MKLSHKRKIAHKRSGAAKGWAKVVRCRQAARVLIAGATALAFALHFPPAYTRPSKAGGDDHKPRSSLLRRAVDAVVAPFRRLKAAGEAQRKLLQGRQ